jgi:putative Mg2+ transporter-C (MgtC) family protein
MPISELQILLRLVTSVVLGGAIGYERQLREQPAGLRTHILVALASATFMLVSLQFVFHQHYNNDGVVRADVGRIASNVVVGIGFLGGGAILHSGLRIKGLTTAASLWLVASIGLASGAGMLVVAAATTLGALFVLVTLRYLEWHYKSVVKLRVRLDLEGDILARSFIEAQLRPIGAVVTDVDYGRDLPGNRSTLLVYVRIASDAVEESLLKRLEALPGVRKIRVRRREF